MSKSIRSFFVSKSVTVEDGTESRKKAKIEASVVEEAVTTESSSSGDASESTVVLERPVPLPSGSISAPVTTTADVQIGWPPFDAMEPGWKAALAAEYERPYFKSLLQFLLTESKSQTVYPPAKDLFSAFNLCPLDQVKVRVLASKHRLLPIYPFKTRIRHLCDCAAGGCDRAGPVPRARSGTRSGVLRAQGCRHSPLFEEHDHRGAGTLSRSLSSASTRCLKFPDSAC